MSGARLVEYRQVEQRIVRLARHGSEQVHQEAYRLKDVVDVQWLVDETPAPMASLRLVRQLGKIEDAEDANRVEFFEAAVGLDTRAADAASGQEDRS